MADFKLHIHSWHCETCAHIMSDAVLAMAAHEESIGRYTGNASAHDEALVIEREMSHDAALVLDAWFNSNSDIVAHAREYDVNVMTAHASREPHWPNGLLDAYSGFGKYEGSLCLVAVLDGIEADETTGDVESFKAYDLHLNLWEALPVLDGITSARAAVLWTDSQGFVEGLTYASDSDARQDFNDVDAQYARIMAHGDEWQ